MQGGTVGKTASGLWRGYWRERDGNIDPNTGKPAWRRHATRSYPLQRDAKQALRDELDRIRLGPRYRPPITLQELCDRFLAQHPASPQTINYARRRLVRPLAVLGDAQAGDVTTEALQRVVTAVPGKSYRRDITRTLRMVYRWGVDAGLVDHNPAAKVKAPKPIRGEKIVPFDSWAELEAVAEECGRWGALVLFMADTGARPAEAVAVEHRHVHGSTVELPGRKTALAWRTVHMTSRGVAACAAAPRALATRCVFHVEGRPISWVYFRREVWAPALTAAGLEQRAPYNLRHTFAKWSLEAGVPIATVAQEMGHESTEHTYRVYGGWCAEHGASAATLREAWAGGTPAAHTAGESRSQSE